MIAYKRLQAGRHHDGTLDEVIARGVEMVHFEQMSKGLLWLCIYFTDGERATFNVHANGVDVVEYEFGERPEWTDLSL